MNEQQFERRIRSAAQDHNKPGETPRERIWGAVDAARRNRRGVRTVGRRFSWRREGLAAAAILVLGVAIGRISLSSSEREISPVTAAADGSRGPASDLYRLAAVEHLRDTEEFLFAFRSDAAAGISQREAAADAADLLSSTRLFLDMISAEDVELGDLLSDLELILVQIAQFTADDRNEIDFISDGLEETEVLTRLRSLLPTEEYAGTPRGAL